MISTLIRKILPGMLLQKQKIAASWFRLLADAIFINIRTKV